MQTVKPEASPHNSDTRDCSLGQKSPHWPFSKRYPEARCFTSLGTPSRASNKAVSSWRLSLVRTEMMMNRRYSLPVTWIKPCFSACSSLYYPLVLPRKQKRDSQDQTRLSAASSVRECPTSLLRAGPLIHAPRNRPWLSSTRLFFRANRAQKLFSRPPTRCAFSPAHHIPTTGRPSAPMAGDLGLNYSSVEFP